jgi:Fe-S cluster assembly scaffold protein SufB
LVELVVERGQRTQLVITEVAPAYRVIVQEAAECTLQLLITRPEHLKVEVILCEPRARVTVQCLVAVDQGQVAIEVIQKHMAADTQSAVLVKGLIAGSGYARLTGTIYIAPQVEQVQASQYHKVLLLSPTAKAVAIPSFAVSSYQVRCNHGAAIGRCNDEHLFYLQSRGLPIPVAQRLIIDSFTSEISAGVPEFSSNLAVFVARVLG